MAEEKEVILNLAASWRQALSDRNLDAMFENYHPDCILFDIKPPHQRTGSQEIRACWEECLPHFPERFTCEHKDLNVTVTGDLAVLHGYFRLIPLSDREKWENELHWCRVTVCYQKVEGKWLVIHEHVSMPFDPTTGKVVIFDLKEL